MQKKKASFNVIDALIIVLVVAVFAAGYIIFFKDEGSLGDDELFELRYVVQVTSLPEEFADNVKVGDTVFDSGTNTVAGTVVAVDHEQAIHVGHDSINGKQALTPIPNYVNLYITIEGDAVENKNTYTVGETNVYVGRYIDMMMSDLTCTGSCISLELVE